MRQQLDLSENMIAVCLHRQYGLDATEIRYLPIGYDLNAWVYQALTATETAYFVKIRAGNVNPASLIVPRILIEHGIPNILAPVRTKTQELCCSLDSFSVLVYPFIQGGNAKITGLSDSQWREFGATLKAIHTGNFAYLLAGKVPAEKFSIPSARLVERITAEIPGIDKKSPATVRLAAFWAEQGPMIAHLIDRAKRLGKQLQSRSFEYVLCHADIHAANILVSTEGRIYLIDWDGPLLAPRERDLLFVAGSTIARRVQPYEEALFFESYGNIEIDMTALAYYRYERILEDIGEQGQRVLWDSQMSEEAKAAEAEGVLLHFQPGEIVESALEADRIQGGPSFPA